MHYEQQYLDLMRHIWTDGAERGDRTGTGTRAVFGAQMRYSLEENAMPLLTTKRVYWKTAAREMLWFLTGDTNIRSLVQQKVHIWTDWPLAKFNQETGKNWDRDTFEQHVISDAEFAAKWGDLGPVYGKQWVDWPVYDAAPDMGEGLYRKRAQGVNQIADLVASLRGNPNSRRHIFEGWNVAEIEQMALPPCHKTYQFFVVDGKLTCLLYQRSCDLALGVPFNIFSAALITRMLAQQCDLQPQELIWNGGDVHLYTNHADLVKEQLSRRPSGQPYMEIARKPASIFDYTIGDFQVHDYAPQAHISAPVAV